MLHPTAKEFQKILLNQPLDRIVQDHLFEGVPYAFRDSPRGFATLRDHLGGKLNLPQKNISIVGSGKIGFSLNPDNFGRQFSENSDIDVLVVNESMFDSIWLNILKWHYPHKLATRGWMDAKWARTNRRNIYLGWFDPSKIRFKGLSFPNVLKPLRDISSNWFNAFRSLSRHQMFASRDFSGRLYRTWDHALLYHIDGLRQIRNAIS